MELDAIKATAAIANRFIVELQFESKTKDGVQPCDFAVIRVIVEIRHQDDVTAFSKATRGRSSGSSTHADASSR
jgi:hypothetical protein